MKLIPMILLVLMSVADSNVAQPCSNAQVNYELDEDEIGVDTEPPEEVRITGVKIERARPNPPFSTSSCDEDAVVVEFEPLSDDRTPSDQLGVQVLFVNGTSPKSLQFWSGRVVNAERLLVLRYKPEEVEEPFDFDIKLAAVDKAGNIGRSDIATIQDIGCSCRSNRESTPIAFLFLILLFGRRMRNK